MRMPGVSARPKLVEPDGFDSPERAELALAIAARQAAAEAVANLQTARSALWSARTKAEGEVERQRAALEAAKTAASDHLLATATGIANKPPVTVREARNMLQDAEDSLATVEAALDGMPERVNQTEAERNGAAARVREAACAVLKTSSETAAVLADLFKAQDMILRRGSLLLWFIKQGILIPKNAYGNDVGDNKVARKARDRMYSPPSYWNGNPRGDLADLSPDAPAWQAALTALETDANAPLPA